MALVKGQTTHKGVPVVSAAYGPKDAKLLQDHKMDLRALALLERTFKAASTELRTFREKVLPTVTAAVKATKAPHA